MASHSDSTGSPGSEKLELGWDGRFWQTRMAIVGAVGLVAAIVLGIFPHDDFRRFFFAYLTGFFFWLTISLGGLIFVLLQHATRAAWSVSVRRIAEWLAASMPVLAILSLPILLSVVLHKGQLYPWAGGYGIVRPGDTTEPNPFKQWYLSPVFWLIRVVICFAVWSFLGVWYWKTSVRQDSTGDINLTQRMQMFAPFSIILYAVTVTIASFDLLMSLDPGWYSTIFGVYIFAGCMVAVFATMTLIARKLQCSGFLQKSITIEHYHDMGKFLFAFVVFWGYIAFSQYMLQWYATLPQETEWFKRRWATTAIQFNLNPLGPWNGWSIVCMILLFGHLLIPFVGLMSRHVKRALGPLTFWCCWMLIAHWFDMFWLVRPEYLQQPVNGSTFDIGFIDLAVWVGVGGIFAATVISVASRAALRPLHDPRLEDSLAFENF